MLSNIKRIERWSTAKKKKKKISCVDGKLFMGMCGGIISRKYTRGPKAQ